MLAYLHASNYLDDLLEIKALIIHSRVSKCKFIMNVFSMILEDIQNFAEKQKDIWIHGQIYAILMRRLIFWTYNFSPN